MEGIKGEGEMKSVKTLIKQLEKIKKQLSDSRDALEELKSEIEMFLETKDEEIYELQNVIDSLSRFV